MVPAYRGGLGWLTASRSFNLGFTYPTVLLEGTISYQSVYQDIVFVLFMASIFLNWGKRQSGTDFSVTYSNPGARGRYTISQSPGRKPTKAAKTMTVFSSKDRESGFHESMEFPNALYAEEPGHMVSYKGPNHTNSNHVNHKIVKQKQHSPIPLQALNDSRSSTGITPCSPLPFLEVPQPSNPLPTTKRSRRTSFPFGFRVRRDEPSPKQEAASLIDAYGKHDCKLCGCERIKLNVSGQYFEAKVGLLDRHPDTLLGNPLKRQQFYDGTRDEFFIDRHRPSFEAIFFYYQYGGRLKRPHTVPDDVFLAEVLFFELEPSVIDEYKRAEGYESDEIELPSNDCFRRVWILFECPETSRWAFCIALVSVITTLVSIVLFCVETLPKYERTHCVIDEAPNFLDPFFIIETICTAWFTFELCIRFIVCPSKLNFWKDFKNLVDATAIVPYYVTFFNVVSTMSCASAKSSASLAFLRVIRLIRVFKLTKHSTGLQVLIRTFKASLEGLGLFLVALIVCLLVFSSAIYYAEIGNEGTQIQSIPDAFWWAIITMTTVGYGDKVPLGAVGKLIGSLCALTGVLTLAIPVPIITGNFNRFYSHKTGRGRHM